MPGKRVRGGSKGAVRLGSKAETLESLAPRLRGASILPLLHFPVSEWRRSPGRIWSRLAGRSDISGGAMIVRSSAAAEDTAKSSNAGRFVSIAGVEGREAFEKAAAEVAASYGKGHAKDRILVQPMLDRVKFGGVAFTIDPNTGGPYFVVNYETRTGRADAVAGGRRVETQTFYCHHEGVRRAPARLRGILALLKELVALTGERALDVEFAVGRDAALYLLQVRPLVAGRRPGVGPERHAHALERVAARIASAKKRHPYLSGKRTVYAVMPDWNPAEIIGFRPRPLALSLYKEMVTDNIWAYQRDNYGYRNLRSFPLLVDMYGIPYVDVRVDFNSFIPSDLSEPLTERLANFYIDRLLGAPTLHDKVEFEILFTCYTFDLPERLEALRRAGFKASETSALAESLRRLTNTIIREKTGLWVRDIEKIGELEARYERIVRSGLDPVSKIYWLIEDCKRYGTLPFAGLARAGFIAVQLLRSLVAVGVLDDAEYAAFMGGLDTVASRLTADFAALGRRAFLKRYGHLRPGTYDILSPRYDEAPDRYFDWRKRRPAPAAKRATLKLSGPQRVWIEDLLTRHGLEYGVDGLLDFIKRASEGREYAKFVFTRSLSEVLRQFGELGKSQGFSLEDCSFADISVLHELYPSCAEPKEALESSVRRGRARYALTESLCLPPILQEPDSAWAFHLPPTEPNFVTQASASGRVRFADAPKKELRGAILMLPSADPGFDWIFSHAIAGFVTQFGGVNSHMAIRAGELGIPAVVGAGEANYSTWSRAASLEIDCALRQVRPLK